MKIRTISIKDAKLNPAERLVLKAANVIDKGIHELIIENSTDALEDIKNIINIITSIAFSVIGNLPKLAEDNYTDLKTKHLMVELLVEKLNAANDIHFKMKLN